MNYQPHKALWLGHAGLNDLTVVSAAAEAWEDELSRPTCEIAEHVAAVGIELSRVVVMQAPADIIWGPAGLGTAHKFVPRINRRGMCLLARLRLQCWKLQGSQCAKAVA